MDVQEHLLSRIVDLLDDGIWVLDRDFRTLYANAQMERLLGVSPASVRPGEALVPDLAGGGALIEGRLTGVIDGARYGFHAAVRRPSGEPMLLDVQASPLPTADKERAVILLICRDLTAQGRASDQTSRLLDLAADLSRALSVSEIVDVVLARGVSAVGAQGGGVSLLTEDGEHFEIAGTAGMPDPLVERWSRYPRVGQFPISKAAASGEPVWIESVDAWRALFPETLPEFVASGFRAMASLPLAFEGRLFGGISFDFQNERTFDEEEKVFMRAVAHQTELALERARLFELEREARAKAGSAEARYRGLFEGSVDAVFVLDPHWDVVDANATALTMLGRTVDALYGRPFRDLWGTDAAGIEHEWDLANELGVWEVEHDLVRVDGSTVPVETRAVAVRTPEERLIIASSREITRRRQIEQTQQALFASVSHDLKSPLSAISLQAQLILRHARKHGEPHAESLAPRLDLILASTQRMSAIIDELVEVAQLRLGHPLKLNYAHVDLVELARQSVQRHREAAPAHRISLSSTQESMIGNWDAGRLERVFDNLLENAVKYSPAGGELAVEISYEIDWRDNGWAVVAVRDRGIGIPAADVPHIFEHFRRGANAQDRMVGSGIGLAGVRQIVEQHGGTVSVESIEGEGSTFRVRLPIRHVDESEHPNRNFSRGEENDRFLAQGVHEVVDRGDLSR